MNAWRLVRLQGSQAAWEWRLDLAKPLLVGRRTPEAGSPDIDLWPDMRVSRNHARIWFENGVFWLEDLRGRHGTLKDGRQIQGLGPVSLEAGTEIQVGDSIVRLASPIWHALRDSHRIVEMEISSTVNHSLVHCGLPMISRLMVRNVSKQACSSAVLSIRIPGLARPQQVSIDALAPGASRSYEKPPLAFDSHALEGQAERRQHRVHLLLDGQPLQGEDVVLWSLAPNEWCYAPEHRLTLAAFVLPNHPLVERIVLDACQHLPSGAAPRDKVAAIYDHLREVWNLAYRIEPPSWNSDCQRIRLPHQVLLNPEKRIGAGTCVDLALLFAACFEQARLLPLIAVCDLGEWRHALVGCWSSNRASLEPLVEDPTRLLHDALWLDPTGCTREPESRLQHADSQAEAERCLREKRLFFGLDVMAARNDGIGPLPFVGNLQWSAAVARALDLARSISLARPTGLGTVPLFLGLLALRDGLTRQILAIRLTDVDSACERLRAALPAQAPDAPASTNYKFVLGAARARAKADGSPLVLEQHVLHALLGVKSVSLQRALRGLGTSQEDLSGLLQASPALRDESRPYSVFSEFPSDF